MKWVAAATNEDARLNHPKSHNGLQQDGGRQHGGAVEMQERAAKTMNSLAVAMETEREAAVETRETIDKLPSDGLISKEVFSAFLASTKLVRLNVGGTMYQTQWSTLNKYPKTRLGRLATGEFENIYQLCDSFNLETCEFFFDQHVEIFPSVIAFYRHGTLHLHGQFCLAAVGAALVYWGLKEGDLEACCMNRNASFKHDLSLNEIDDDDDDSQDQAEPQVVFKTGKFAKFQSIIWYTLEDPTSSVAAKVWWALSIMFILVSTTMLVMGTTQWFTDYVEMVYSSSPDTNQIEADTFTSVFNASINGSNVNDANDTAFLVASANRNATTTTPSLVAAADESDHPLINLVETVCIVWFTFEFLIRFASTPNKRQFMRNELNIIDLLSILPYYIAAAISGHSESITTKFTTARKLLQLLRILRILRVLKIARHSSGLKALGYTVKQSYQELGMIALFFALGVLLFSTLVYYVEKDTENTKFTSIPQAFWYAASSMTTVGYGDITPTTAAGKILGIVCCLFGVLVIAIPIPIIVNSFTEYLARQRKRQQNRHR